MTHRRFRWAVAGTIGAGLSLLSFAPARAQQISVDEVVSRMILADAVVDDYTADVVRNAGKPDEYRGTSVFRKANESRVQFTLGSGGAPVNRLAVGDFMAFASFDNDANAVVTHDYGLDPSNADWRTLQRLASGSPILHWRFLGGASSVPVAADNRYTLEVYGANVQFEITVDTQLGALVRRKTYVGGSLAVDETWSGFMLVDGKAQLPKRYEVLTTANGNTTTVDYSNFQLNTNPPERRFQAP